MNDIDKHLPNHICKTCKYLDYFDWYFCKLGKHQTKRQFLNMRKLSKCDSYEKMYGTGKNCKDKDCVFWCLDCSYYKKEDD